ncbi:efflux RND transporter periplasmic adaptor subunit [Petrachloros mirabilis]
MNESRKVFPARPSGTLWFKVAGAKTVMLVMLLAMFGCTQESDGNVAPSKQATPEGLDTLTISESAIEQIGIEVQMVARGTFQTHRDFPGTIKPNENALAEITALVRGRVIEVDADLGKNVEGGERLAVLYSKELGLAQSSFLKAHAKLNVAEHAFARAQFLLKEKVIGKGEFQRREGELVSARAEAKGAENHMKLLGMTDKTIAEIKRNQEIQSYVPIVAPFAGRIIQRNVTAGEVVETMEKLFVVADLSKVWVLADVPEKDIGFIQNRGEDSGSVDVQVSAYPGESFRGKLAYMGDVLDPATRTMRVRVEVPNPDGRLKPEMFATVRVFSNPEPNAIVIPKAAVQQDRGEPVVFIRLNPQQFGRRVIHIAERDGEKVHVRSGLRDGEEVVVAGAYVLKSELAAHQGGAVSD